MAWLQDPEGNVHEINNYLRAITLINSQGWKRISDYEVQEMNREAQRLKRSRNETGARDYSSPHEINRLQQEAINTMMYVAATEASSHNNEGTTHKHTSDHGSSHHSSHDHFSGHDCGSDF